MSSLAILTNDGERAAVKFQGNSHYFKTCKGSCDPVTESLHAALQSNTITHSGSSHSTIKRVTVGNLQILQSP